MITVVAMFCVIGVLVPIDTQSQTNEYAADSTVSEVLIPASATMQRAWDLPRNPLTDSLPEKKQLADQIKLGYHLFTDTRHSAPNLTGNAMSCNDCHPNAGQRENARARSPS